MIPNEHLTGLILAGGRGSRMGGIDKGLQTFQGRPFVAHVIERLRPQVGALLINANRNETAYAAWGASVVADADPAGFHGPLAGMLAGLIHSRTDWIVTAPCDSPFLPLNLVQRLAEAVNPTSEPQRRMAIACTPGDGGRRQREPVFSLMHRDLAPSLGEALARGEGRIVGWAMSVGCAEVLFDDASAFANINTPEDLQAHERPALD